ncbi:MAG: GNAT family N-acetyltransferase [Candidatus Aenigmarchaeota archaeon]|nr:GNAT family N-acetyltransferase [Candidatus Aenigmarchaeota archaeon]
MERFGVLIGDNIFLVPVSLICGPGRWVLEWYYERWRKDPEVERGYEDLRPPWKDYEIILSSMLDLYNLYNKSQGSAAIYYIIFQPGCVINPRLLRTSSPFLMTMALFLLGLLGARPIGEIGIDNLYVENLEGKEKQWAFNILIGDPQQRRRGYGTEAASLFLEHLKKLGLEGVYSYVKSYNDPSIRLHERLGFKKISSGSDGEEIVFYLDL